MRLGVLLLAAGLAGCSLPSADLPPTTTYRLAVPALPPAAARRPVHLVVHVAYVAPEIAAEAIVLELPGHRLDRIANARWPAPLPAYVQQQLIRAFSRSGAFRHVSDAPVPGGINYQLRLELLDFQAATARQDAAPRIRVRIHAVLQRLDEVAPRRATVIRATAEAAAAERRMQAIAAAFDQAFDDVVRRLAADVHAALASRREGN